VVRQLRKPTSIYRYYCYFTFYLFVFTPVSFLLYKSKVYPVLNKLAIIPRRHVGSRSIAPHVLISAPNLLPLVRDQTQGFGWKSDLLDACNLQPQVTIIFSRIYTLELHTYNVLVSSLGVAR
jgi:hypothetical protein